jgi:MOSC domain-containing protein YiiM
LPRTTSRLFSWLNTWRDDELVGVLEGIFIAPTAGAPMQPLESVLCEPGRGLQGDRYALGQGHWIKTDGCQVTLVRSEDIARASKRGPVSFEAGTHRRNLVVSHIPLAAYHRRRLSIGEATFEFERLRPPCGYLDRLLKPGAAKALGKAAGIGLRVIEGGTIRVGDEVRVLSEPAVSQR